jgi:hypothetical protein
VAEFPDNTFMRRPIVRGVLIPLLLMALLIAGVSWWRWRTEREGRERLDAVVAELDSTDPGWRWEDIEAGQPVLRDEENAARIVAEFRQTVGVDRYFRVNLPADTDPRYGPSSNSIRNRLLDSEAYRLIDQELADTEPGWPEIERLAETARGRCRLPASAVWLERQRSKEERVVPVLNYLEWESERLALKDNPDRQETIARAYLNASRIEDVSAGFGSVIDRRRYLQDVVRHIERMLALDRLGDRLPRLQDELAREAEVDLYRMAARLERAQYDRLLQAIAVGEPSYESSLEYNLYGPYAKDKGFRVAAETWLYRPHLAADWASALSYATSALAVADQPDPARLTAHAAIPSPPKDDRHPFSRTCANSLTRHLEGAHYTKALLRCAAVGLAVERHRLLTGAWPPTLEEIPQTILPNVPADPFTGNPLGYMRRPDGVIVFSTGPKRIEFKLYNPDQRRLPVFELGPDPRIVKDVEP